MPGRRAGGRAARHRPPARHHARRRAVSAPSATGPTPRATTCWSGSRWAAGVRDFPVLHGDQGAALRALPGASATATLARQRRRRPPLAGAAPGARASPAGTGCRCWCGPSTPPGSLQLLDAPRPGLAGDHERARASPSASAGLTDFGHDQRSLRRARPRRPGRALPGRDDHAAARRRGPGRRHPRRTPGGAADRTKAVLHVHGFCDYFFQTDVRRVVERARLRLLRPRPAQVRPLAAAAPDAELSSPTCASTSPRSTRRSTGSPSATGTTTS